MKAVALVLLVSCAPAASSLPWVRVDSALPGAVCSREAAVSLAQARARERGEWQKRLIDCDERAALSDARAARAQWWERSAPWLIAAAGVLGLGIGAVVGFGVGGNK